LGSETIFLKYKVGVTRTFLNLLSSLITQVQNVRLKKSTLNTNALYKQNTIFQHSYNKQRHH